MLGDINAMIMVIKYKSFSCISGYFKIDRDFYNSI